MSAGQYLVFVVGGSEYAVPIVRVREILQYGGVQVTRVPGVPPCFRGVMNLRGTVVPVVDLSVKLGLPESAPTRWSCVVLVDAQLGGETVPLAIVADQVSQVLELEPSEIEPVPAFGTQVRPEYLTGMGRTGNGFVLLLDLDRALSEDELRVAADVA